MSQKYQKPRPHIPAALRREAEVEAGHKCSVAQCEEHTYLDLHHIDGNRENNHIGNVILLCAKHHRMAESNAIDRKSFREYKRLNREKAGLSPIFFLADDKRDHYLHNLLEWLETELKRLEFSPISQSSERPHVVPIVRLNGQTIDYRLEEGRFVQQIDAFLNEKQSLLLLGNGGSGKTVLMMSWLHSRCKQALDNPGSTLPVYVPLKALTLQTNLVSLIRAAFGKHGVTLTPEQVDNLLRNGLFVIALDGFNEINRHAIEAGADQDIQRFVESYPLGSFVLSSRYVQGIAEMSLSRVEVLAWGKDRVRGYLESRLGQDLGKKAFDQLGDDLDFEWLSGCSVAGFCSNPLTLWMLATQIEADGNPQIDKSDMVTRLIDTMVNRIPRNETKQLANSTIQELLKRFAYFMLNAGFVLSTSYEVAIKISNDIIGDARSDISLPKHFDAYDLLSALTASGLVRRSQDSVEWLHQAVQEHLSISYSEEKFSRFCEICKLVRCPQCDYRADGFITRDGKYIGVCEEHGEYEIPTCKIPATRKLKQKVKFIDRTGRPEPEDKHMVLIPRAIFDEQYWAELPMAGTLFIRALSYLQSASLFDRSEIREWFREDEIGLIDFEVWALVEAGMFRLRHKNDVTNITLYSPMVNPSARLVN